MAKKTNFNKCPKCDSKVKVQKSLKNYINNKIIHLYYCEVCVKVIEISEDMIDGNNKD